MKKKIKNKNKKKWIWIGVATGIVATTAIVTPIAILTTRNTNNSIDSAVKLQSVSAEPVFISKSGDINFNLQESITNWEFKYEFISNNKYKLTYNLNELILLLDQYEETQILENDLSLSLVLNYQINNIQKQTNIQFDIFHNVINIQNKNELKLTNFNISFELTFDNDNIININNKNISFEVL